ncbi:orotate phosphoribosyltransferase [Flammeovirga kamogawensis]|uniref:orotate phosphoribosyltransferase n=1 Tax=Flammeovirga kamogawensis TaxID=373891 RepID=UPI001183B460|nr:orotate phosphoribosyltransferase [Flammeovirga kamogawensis]MBB6461292.1 orotate phosphoribosyltransferase [Flammeovirga kamogawensis]TRX69656.1 orotate phosphoribosyltransferase [Flammeovirga kamogawensis]
MENTIAKKVASLLLEINAIKIRPNDPFTWASGWKSPIYCDNRLSLSHPQARTYIKHALCAKIQEQFEGVEAIVGVATAGIPQGALIADALGIPFAYVRSKPKGHGMTNMIEGELKSGAKVVVVEDLISTGGSSLKAAEALKEAGIEVMGMLAIFTYGFDLSVNNFKEAGIPLVTLSNYNAMLELALEKDYIQANDLESLKSWRTSPSEWGK